MPFLKKYPSDRGKWYYSYLFVLFKMSDIIFYPVNSMLLWFVDSEVAHEALAGRLIGEDEVEVRPGPESFCLLS